MPEVGVFPEVAVLRDVCVAFGIVVNCLTGFTFTTTVDCVIGTVIMAV